MRITSEDKRVIDRQLLSRSGFAQSDVTLPGARTRRDREKDKWQNSILWPSVYSGRLQIIGAVCGSLNRSKIFSQ